MAVDQHNPKRLQAAPSRFVMGFRSSCFRLPILKAGKGPGNVRLAAIAKQPRK